MAMEQSRFRPGDIDGRERQPRDAEQPDVSLRDRVRHLAEDSAQLVRQEIQLAKIEAREIGAEVAKDLAQVGVAIGILALGGLALTAFLILVVGLLLGGAYWAGALIVGVVFALVGGVMAMRAIRDLRRHGVKPDETVESLKEDREFAEREAEDFKRRMSA